MAKKRARTVKQSSAKKTAPAGKKRPAAKSVKAAPAKAPAKLKAKAPSRAAAPARSSAPPAASAPSAVLRAERLRDDVQRSKMTHPDPWGYTGKARGWSERAERLVADAQAGRDVRAALDTLTGELDADRDFQEARRLF